MLNQPENSPSAVLVDLASLSTADRSGPQWAHESTDLDLTLLTWTTGQHVPAHVNDEVDVVLVVVSGVGEVVVNAEVFRLVPGQALLIPKGAERTIRCAGDRFSYVSIHRRRRGLWPTIKGG